MRHLAVLIVAVAFSGCFTELLGPPSSTTRTIACAVLEGQDVIIEHHGEPLPGANEALAAWFAVMADATETDVLRFSSRAGDPIGDDVWLSELEIFDGGVVLHVLWGEAETTVDNPRDGVVAINTTLYQAAVDDGSDPETSVRGLLFHGLGHALGVVNRGVPRYDAGAPMHETDGFHEAGGVMSARWHKADDLPAEADRYPESVVRDWRNAVADPRICP